MRFDDEITIQGPIDSVWAVYADVEHWSEWTASIRSCRYVAGTTLAIGSRVRIEQPKLPTAEWEVTALEPGKSWTWVAKAPGIRTTAVHTLEETSAATTLVRQTIVQAGPLGVIIGRLYARLTRSYLAMEAAGLKERCEAGSRR